MKDAIFSWLYGAGKVIGADKFFQLLGPWGTLALAIVIGLACVLLWAFIYNKTLTNDMHAVLRFSLAFIELAIFAYLMYLFVVGNIGIIERLGGINI